MTDFELGAVSRLTDLDRRVSRLETLETPPGGVGGFTLIEEIRLTANAQEFKFENIPQTYQHLYWDASLRATMVPATSNTGWEIIYLQMNGDTGANYAWGEITVAFPAQAVNDTKIQVGRVIVPYTGTPTYDDAYTSQTGWMHHYHSTVKKTPVTWILGTMSATVAEVGRSLAPWKGSGVWDNTAGITELRFHGFTAVSPNLWFRPSSRISLYGVGQATT